MKLFVLGAEGAGKTVFVTMLSRYLALHHKDLVLEPADFATSQYVVEAQEALSRGDWPAATRMGEPIALRWCFRAADRPSRQLVMYDAAGEDLRTLLLTDNLSLDDSGDSEHHKRATVEEASHLKPHREQLSQADAIIYLLDLESLIGAKDARAHNEACWLLKAFVSHPQWRHKKRLVVLTKRDKYDALLAQYDNDVCKCLRMNLPGFYRMDQWCKQEGVEYAAMSSVVTTTLIDHPSGAPLRVPATSLQPGDMSCVIDCLCGPAALDSDVIRICAGGFDCKGLFYGAKVPQETAKLFVESFASEVSPTDVVLLHDARSWAWTPYGFLLTSDSVYWRNSDGGVGNMSYSDLRQVFLCPTDSEAAWATVNCNDDVIDIQAQTMAESNRLGRILVSIFDYVRPYRPRLRSNDGSVDGLLASKPRGTRKQRGTGKNAGRRKRPAKRAVIKKRKRR